MLEVKKIFESPSENSLKKNEKTYSIEIAQKVEITHAKITFARFSIPFSKWGLSFFQLLIMSEHNGAIIKIEF